MSAPAKRNCCAIRTAISQYLINLCSPSECTAGEFWKQVKCSNTSTVLPLIAQDFLSASASQAFTKRLYSVSGILTPGAEVIGWTKISK